LKTNSKSFSRGEKGRRKRFGNGFCNGFNGFNGFNGGREEGKRKKNFLTLPFSLSPLLSFSDSPDSATLQKDRWHGLEMTVNMVGIVRESTASDRSIVGKSPWLTVAVKC
jgi:hypothetical protein